MNRLSRIFQPSLIIPKNATVKNQDITSKSQRVSSITTYELRFVAPLIQSLSSQLMLEQGLIRQAGNGTFYILPLLQRSVQKAIDLVDHYMQRMAGAEKLTLPILTSADLWRKSGRLETAGGELMSTTDRHGKRQILGPVGRIEDECF